jgi:hypothetical protein
VDDSRRSMELSAPVSVSMVVKTPPDSAAVDGGEVGATRAGDVVGNTFRRKKRWVRRRKKS